MRDVPADDGDEDGAPVASPCTKICMMTANGQCVGCKRTLDEIALWGSMTEAERRGVILRLPSR